MGHSWGTFIAIQAAVSVPELYYAYIGMSQIAFQKESEDLAYELLKQYRLAGDTKMVRKLEKFVTETEEGYIYSKFYLDMVRDDAMHKLGVGTTHRMKSVISGIFFPVMECKAYTISEKINIWRGKSFLKKKTKLWKKMMETDLREIVTSVDIPVYFISGIYDYTVNYSLARGYLENINAPIKGFYTFKESAHSPIFEEPEKMIQILTKDVLSGTTNLAD